MFGEFVLLEPGGEGASRSGARLPLGETSGRNEAWLRDVLFAHPEILPIRELDPGFGPLIPLCRELRTEAGPIDIAYINPHGRLTLVECKLWRNAEARRKVVAQVLDYARAISRWTYSDLRRQVSAATGQKGDVPFQLASAVDPTLTEHGLADDVTRALRAGRFLWIVAGDGIREDVGAMSELINRNAASAFSLALVEVALYDVEDLGLLVQPRVLARTQLIERQFVTIREAGGEAIMVAPAMTGPDNEAAAEPAAADTPKQAAYRAFWTPVIAAPLDDPDQEPASLRYPNNVRAPLPWPRTWITAYRGAAGGETLGVQLAGGSAELAAVFAMMEAEVDLVLEALPTGSRIVVADGVRTFRVTRPGREFSTDADKQAWLAATLNGYVNVLRPRLRRMMDGSPEAA